MATNITEFLKFHRLLTTGRPEYMPFYFPLAKGDKNPLGDRKWKDEKSRLTLDEAIQWMERGHNIGIAGTDKDGLVIIDIDNEDAITDIKTSLSTRSRKRTGKHYFYFTTDANCKVNIPTENHGEVRSNWQYVVAAGSFVNTDPAKLEKPVSESQAAFVGQYTVEDEIPPSTITYAEFPLMFRERKEKTKEKIEPKKTNQETLNLHPDDKSALYKLTIENVVGSAPNKARFSSLFHGSDTGANTSIKDGLLHCWRHNVSHSPLTALAVMAGLADCVDAGHGHSNSGVGASVIDLKDGETIHKLWIFAKKENIIPQDDKMPYRAREWLNLREMIEKENASGSNTEGMARLIKSLSEDVSFKEIAVVETLIMQKTDGLERLELEKLLREQIGLSKLDFKDIKKEVTKKFKETAPKEVHSDLRTQAISLNQFSPAESVANLINQFLIENPIYYDAKAHLFWAWVFNEKKWAIVDDVEVLRIFKDKYAIVEWINPAIRGKFLDSLKVLASKRPEDAPIKFIQFKNYVYNIETEETFEATPKYFFTNPIPHDLGENDEIPVIDKMVGEWVCEKDKQAIYETTAYTLLRAYPIQRVFVLHGEGANGKGTYLSLLRRFLGNTNVTATDYDRLADTNQRFEKMKLLNKLACQLGELEVSMFSKTSSLKELSSGTDLISAEQKGKNPFDFINFAKIIIATNKLPMTIDKSDGFYRRFNIIDFPNQFADTRDILAEIPNEEYPKLARKCINVLRNLLKNGTFCNDGSIEDRRNKYESLSNPIKQYILDNYKLDVNGYIIKSGFKEEFTNYLKANRFQIMNDRELSNALKCCGYTEKKKRIGLDTHTVILGISLKNDDEKEAESSTIDEENDKNVPDVPTVPSTEKKIIRSSSLNVPDVPRVPLSYKSVLYRGADVKVTELTEQLEHFSKNELKKWVEMCGEFYKMDILERFGKDNEEQIMNCISELKHSGDVFEPKSGFFKAI